MRLRKTKWLRAGRYFALTLVVIAAWPVEAQQYPTQNVPAFRADSGLVLVPVTVVDRRGSTVNGLASDAFMLTEDGVRQQIHSFSEADEPVSTGIVLDLSGSMRTVLGAAKESLRALMKDANPDDEAFLNAVSTSPRAFSGFTDHFDELLHKVAFEDAGGNTALFDTIYGSLNQLRSGVHPRRALVVISDGMDNHSRYSRQELLNRAMECDTQIYTIAAGNPTRYAKPMAVMEARRGLLFLDELAAKTGGLSFIVNDPTEIAMAAARIGGALRSQYTIGYVPRGNDRNGKWRRIGVKIADSGLRAYARAGYRPD